MTSSNTDETKATEICTKLLPQIRASWGDFHSIKAIANSAFNCVWGEHRLDGSAVEPVKDCVAWLRKVYWKDDTWKGTYTGRCKENEYNDYHGSIYAYIHDLPPDDAYDYLDDYDDTTNLICI